MNYNPMTEAVDYVQWLIADGVEPIEALTKAANSFHVQINALAIAYQAL